MILKKIIFKLGNLNVNYKNINLLTINHLGKTTKIVTKMFGSSTFLSYLYIVRLTNNNYKLKPYGV